MNTSSDDWRHQSARVLELRYLVLAVVGTAAVVMAGGRGDWNLFTDAARDLMSDEIGLGVYVARPDVQTGPITLVAHWVLAALPQDGFGLGVVGIGCLGLWSIRQIEVAAAPRWSDRDGLRVATLVGGGVTIVAWAQLGGFGHLDDAVVLTVAVRCALGRDRALVRAVLVGLAVGVKPWAVVLAPLVLDWPVVWQGASTVRARLVALLRWSVPVVVAGGVGLLCWLPFVVHAPDTVSSLKPTLTLADDSVLALFGWYTADVPSWIRSAQLAAALLVACWCCARGRRTTALMAAIAVRMVTDLGTWGYYTPGLLVGTLLFDLVDRRRMLPALTVACAVLLGPDWVIGQPEVRASMRLVACVLVVAAALWAPLSGPAPSAAPRCPSSDPLAAG